MSYQQISLDDISPRMKPIRIEKPIRLIELFAGYGSQAMALERIGARFERYRVVELDKYAVANYNAVHGTNFPVTDITEVHAEDLRIVDIDEYAYLLTYSFPCQSLSVAGKRAGMDKGSGTRSSLLWEVERILKECVGYNGNLPDVLMMENVPAVHNRTNMPNFQKWLAVLESFGYRNYWQDLNAADYGIPQNRLRTFCISLLGNYTYRFPKPIPLTCGFEELLDNEVDEKYYNDSENARRMIDELVARGWNNPYGKGRVVHGRGDKFGKYI